MRELVLGLLLWITGSAACGGKVDGAPDQLTVAPAMEPSPLAMCERIQDYRACVAEGCLWGGPDRCDGRSPPPGEVQHLAQGGCFAASPCTEDGQCGAGAGCGYLAYAPCYFAADGDGPQCTAYDSQICTYFRTCIDATP